MARNDAAAPGQLCPDIRIQTIDIVQLPCIRMPPDIDPHQKIVRTTLAMTRSAAMAGNTSLALAALWPSVCVAVVMAHPRLRRAALVASLRSEVDVVIRGVRHVDAAGVGRVGVKDRALLVLVEDTGPFTVRHPRTEARIVEELRAAFELLRSERHAVVVIEVVVVRREPLEAPSHSLPELFELFHRRPGDDDKRHVAVIEVNDDVIEVVSPERAMLTTLAPIRRKHEVVDDELTSLLEE